MSDVAPSPLSELLGDPARSTASRREFLGRVSALGFTVGGAALVACTPDGTRRADTTTGRSTSGNAPGAVRALHPSGSTALHQNPDSKLDTALGHETQRSSATPDATRGAERAILTRRDPALPPLSADRTLRLRWRAQERPVRITDDTTVAAWTFEGDLPGPVVHCRAGDTVEFTLTNEAAIPHSMDFHAAQIDPKTAFRSVIKGDSVSYKFTPKFAGAFMYHCGTAPVLMHIGSGMYGAIVVTPREPLAAAREFVLVQSEFYLGDAAGGVRAFDYTKMLSTLPDYVAFNGRPSQYMREPIRVKVGERARFWVVNAGPTHPCAFHVVGEQFDTVYLGAPPGTPIRGVQTFAVPAGGGMCFELACDVAGEFPFVNHSFGHGQKGAIGVLAVTP